MTTRTQKEYNGRNVDKTAVLPVDDLPMPANFDGLDPAEANKTRARFEHSRRIYEMLFGAKTRSTTGISEGTAQTSDTDSRKFDR
ncbi:MAG: hypothetical protein ACI4CY_05010 [Candidatus Gastranaerophilaceae bacterium]